MEENKREFYETATAVLRTGALMIVTAAVAGTVGYGKCYYDNKDKISEKVLLHITISRKPNYRK